jgi:hypothetical protein
MKSLLVGLLIASSLCAASFRDCQTNGCDSETFSEVTRTIPAEPAVKLQMKDFVENLTVMAVTISPEGTWMWLQDSIHGYRFFVRTWTSVPFRPGVHVMGRYRIARTIELLVPGSTLKISLCEVKLVKVL